MTNVPERVKKLEHVDPWISDHQLIIMRTKDGKEIEDRREQQKERDGEVKIGQVKWDVWEEVDICEYNDTLRTWLGDVEARDVEEREKKIAEAIEVSAIWAEEMMIGNRS